MKRILMQIRYRFLKLIHNSCPAFAIDILAKICYNNTRGRLEQSELSCRRHELPVTSTKLNSRSGV